MWPNTKPSTSVSGKGELELKISAVVVDIIKVSIDGGSTEGEDSIDGGSTEVEDTHRPSKRDFYRVEKHTPRRQFVTLLQRTG